MLYVATKKPWRNITTFKQTKPDEKNVYFLKKLSNTAKNKINVLAFPSAVTQNQENRIAEMYSETK